MPQASIEVMGACELREDGCRLTLVRFDDATWHTKLCTSIELLTFLDGPWQETPNRASGNAGCSGGARRVGRSSLMPSRDFFIYHTEVLASCIHGLALEAMVISPGAGGQEPEFGLVFSSAEQQTPRLGTSQCEAVFA